MTIEEIVKEFNIPPMKYYNSKPIKISKKLIKKMREEYKKQFIQILKTLK